MRRPLTSSREARSAIIADGVRVVPVVEQHLERVLVEDVHAARRLEERGVEGAQALADRIELDAQRERHRGGEHRILHVVQWRALPSVAGIRCVHSSGMWPPAIVQGDHLAVDARLERAGAAAGANMFAHQRVMRIHGHVADGLGFGVARHLEHQRIVGVEHGAVGGDLDHDALHLASCSSVSMPLRPK